MQAYLRVMIRMHAQLLPAPTDAPTWSTVHATLHLLSIARSLLVR